MELVDEVVDLVDELCEIVDVLCNLEADVRVKGRFVWNLDQKILFSAASIKN